MPQVTVIIPTYNWSSVLRYALRSVLWQTFQDFEVWVVGDGCTDDSGEVVAAFDDPRLHWHNLPINHGSQYAPNNKGLELAQGQYIAYLGHDDLWHPNHLQSLITTIEREQADGAYALAEMIGPPPANVLYLHGLAASGEYEHGLLVPPSSIMHRRAMLETTGGWKDYRTMTLSPDIEFISRAWEHGQRFVPTHELTLFKFPATSRKNIYRTKSSDEQAAFAQRILTEPELQYREMVAILASMAANNIPLIQKFQLVEGMQPGLLVQNWQAFRGVEAKPLPQDQPQTPIYENLQDLLLVNQRRDITPFASRQALHLARTLLADGLLLGRHWYHLEDDAWGMYRWANTNAEIVITHPTGHQRRIHFEVLPGPGVNYQPFTLQIMSAESNQPIHTQSITGQTIFEVELPIQPGTGQIFTLNTSDGGQAIEADPRIMNFQVRQVAWA